MKIIVIGSATFIGSHTIVELLNDGYEVMRVVNFCNPKKIVIERINEMLK